MKSSPIQLVRSRRILIIRYVFGDESGTVFGISWKGDTTGINYQFKVWGLDNDVKSSNYRESTILVDAVEDMENDGQLHGAEFFMFIDNSVIDGAVFEGFSSKRLLFNLVFRLKIIEQYYCVSVNFIHVADREIIV